MSDESCVSSLSDPAPKVGCVIRCPKTGRFYHDGEWTDFGRVTIFATQVDAIRAAMQRKLGEVDILAGVPGSQDFSIIRIR